MIWPGYGRLKVTGQNGQKGSTIPQEVHWGKIYQTSLDNRAVEQHIIVCEWEHFYSGKNY